MPLIGFTTDSFPGQVFKPEELLTWLAGPDNVSDMTHAMLYSAMKSLRGEGVLSATGLTGICPREFYFRTTTDYTERLESQFYAIQGSQFHAMVESAPFPDNTEGFRERRFGKWITLADGTRILLPGRMDEVILDWMNGKALIRDYKRTKALPKYSAYKLHKKQLSIYRMILSSFPEPPVMLPDGVEYWEAGANEKWVPAPAIDAAYGEIVYVAPDGSKRCQMSPDGKQKLDEPVETYNYLRDMIAVYLGKPGLTYQQATSGEESFAWKCDNFCPVRDACFAHRYDNEQVFDPVLAAKQLKKLGYAVTIPGDF